MIRQVIEAESRDLNEVYRGFADNFLSVSPRFGRFLYMCARRLQGGTRIVEFGSSMGISRDLHGGGACATWAAAA